MTAKTVYLHIGPFKTGTTYLQSVLERNADRLAERGVLFPGGRYNRQVRAVLDLFERQRDRDHSGTWGQLAAEVQEWDGDRAVFSQEFLCSAKPRQVRRIVRTLAPAEVHVVFTARELSRVIPAMWQTHLRNRSYPTWAEFISSVRDPQDSASNLGRRFWRRQDPAKVLAVWERHVPRQQISIVTVPPAGSDPQLLWQRFCEVCGLDGDAFETDVPRINTSLGLAEAEALRRVNEGLAGRMTRNQQNHWVKFFLARGVLERRPNPIMLQLPVEDYPWVAERARAVIDFLDSGGYRVVGDLADLVTPPPPTTAGPHPGQVDPAAVLDAAVEALVEVLVAVRQHGPHPHGAKPRLAESRQKRRRRD